MVGRRAMGAGLVLLLACSAGAQSLNLGPAPRPQQETGQGLVVLYASELEDARTDRERALVRLGARLARTGDSAHELASRTIADHLEPLLGTLREAETTAASGEADPILRQRLREHLLRLDRLIDRHDPGEIGASDLRSACEAILGTISEIARELEGDVPVTVARLSHSSDVPEAPRLLGRAAGLAEDLAPSVARLAELIELLDGVRAVPALESTGTGGLRAVGAVLDFLEMDRERFIPRAAAHRLDGALERCLFDAGEPRAAPEALAMLSALARIGGLVERSTPLEGDTARRVEPVLGAMLDRLRSPADAEMLGLMLPPVERSFSLVARGAALPGTRAVSAQLQYAWRFLLPQEQDARVAAIQALEQIVGDPASIASPQVVSALVAHAESVESLEALLGVDVLQEELDTAGIAGAVPALEALRAQLRLMGDRDGYRAAGEKVLPVVRTLARYRSMPGIEEVRTPREGEPEWATALRGLLDERLDGLRVRLAMELIGVFTGTPVPDEDGERATAQETLETLRRTVIASADLLELTGGGLQRLDALPEFEVFEGGDGDGRIGTEGAIGLDELLGALGEAVGSLEGGDAQRASALLDGVDERLVIVGVLAELSRRVTDEGSDGASAAALEAALVLRRVEALDGAGPALVELSLAGRYRAEGLDTGVLRRYMAEQAERAIDSTDWLREAWQRRR